METNVSLHSKYIYIKDYSEICDKPCPRQNRMHHFTVKYGAVLYLKGLLAMLATAG